MADLGAIGFTDLTAITEIETLYSFGQQDPAAQATGITTIVVPSSHFWMPVQAQTTETYTVPSLAPNQGTITGKVFYDNVPLDNQAVILCFTKNHFEISRIKTDSSGQFAFYGLESTSNAYYITVVHSTFGVVKINLTPDTFVEIGLFSVTARRPLVLINGRISEAPDGTTWAVGVPTAMGKYSANVGDGSNTSYTITHSLGTRDIVVEVRDNNSPYGVIDVDWEATTTAAITITFITAPSTNRYRVNIIAL